MVQGTGRLRKLRWSIPGRGKSGGIRTLYVDFADYEQIHMIACFKKANKENLTNAEKHSIKNLIEQIKNNLRKQRNKK